jgi:glycogen(starch) synthase
VEFPHKQVLIVANAFQPSVGGYETFARFLADGLADETTVTVITDTLGGDGRDFTYTVLRRPGFFTLIDKANLADLIVLNSMSLKFFLRLLPFRKRCVVIHHTTYSHRTSVKNHIFEPLKRWLAKICPLNICVSAYVAESIGGNKVVIHNPYDHATFFPRRTIERDRKMLFVGRLVLEKGGHVLIQALRIVRKTYPDWTLSIVGDGPERHYLERLARQLGQTGSVYFLGKLDPRAVADQMRAHPIMVIPSLYEPFGIVALEGLACGCVIVCSDARGLLEASGGFGFTSVAGDVNSLANSICSAIRFLADRTLDAPSTSLDEFLTCHRSEKVLATYKEALAGVITK